MPQCRPDSGVSCANLCSPITLLSPGLEEFENKIDKLAGDNNGNGNGGESDSWLGKLYHKFKDSFGGEENTLATSEMDGMESPILDETWGLGDISKLYDSSK